MNNNKEKIKILLKQGLTVISPRESGKSIAILELINEEDNSVMMVLNQHSKFYAEITFKSLFGVEPKPGKILIGSDDLGFKRFTLGKHFDDRKIYVDEFLHNSYKGKFFARVSSLDDTLVILP